MRIHGIYVDEFDVLLDQLYLFGEVTEVGRKDRSRHLALHIVRIVSGFMDAA